MKFVEVEGAVCIDFEEGGGVEAEEVGGAELVVFAAGIVGDFGDDVWGEGAGEVVVFAEEEVDAVFEGGDHDAAVVDDVVGADAEVVFHAAGAGGSEGVGEEAVGKVDDGGLGGFDAFHGDFVGGGGDASPDFELFEFGEDGGGDEAGDVVVGECFDDGVDVLGVSEEEAGVEADAAEGFQAHCMEKDRGWVFIGCCGSILGVGLWFRWGWCRVFGLGGCRRRSRGSSHRGGC